MIDAAPLLSAEKLGRQSDGTWLLRDVSLTIQPGEWILLQGPTGAGKSVLLRLLSALDPPDEGRLLWRAAPIADDAVPEFRRQVVYCHQQPCFVPGTVEDNLRLACSLAAAREPYDKGRAADLLERAGRSSALLRASTEHLSGGEQLAAALVRAMLASPQLLLLDEPTAALDQDSVEQCERLVRQWMDESPERSVVWVTHDSQQADRLAGRRLQMADGRLDERLCDSGQDDG